MAMLNNQRVPYNENLMETQPTQIDSTLWVCFFQRSSPKCREIPALKSCSRSNNSNACSFKVQHLGQPTAGRCSFKSKHIKSDMLQIGCPKNSWFINVCHHLLFKIKACWGLPWRNPNKSRGSHVPCSCINHWAHWHPHQHHALPFPANQPNETETDLAYLAKTQDSSVVKWFMPYVHVGWSQSYPMPEGIGSSWGHPMAPWDPWSTELQWEEAVDVGTCQPVEWDNQASLCVRVKWATSTRRKVVLEISWYWDCAVAETRGTRKSLPPPASARAQAPFSARTACSTARPWLKVGFHTKLSVWPWNKATWFSNPLAPWFEEHLQHGSTWLLFFCGYKSLVPWHWFELCHLLDDFRNGYGSRP
jgi:hypothetical protein